MFVFLGWMLAGAASATPHAVTAVESIAIPVTDVDRSVEFYTQVLGFKVVAEQEAAGADYEHFLGVFGARVRVVRLSLGQEAIELLQFLAPGRGRPLPVDLQSNDRAFQHVAIIVRDTGAGERRAAVHRLRNLPRVGAILGHGIRPGRAAGAGRGQFRGHRVVSMPPLPERHADRQMGAATRGLFGLPGSALC
jgi:catechol 2,3-dioxygenase-like lactoylglutathione lyase family enzyme